MRENNIKKVFEKHLDIINRQSKILLEDFNELQKFVPLTKDFVSNLSSSDRRIIDAFIFGFGRLQDILGSKIFRSLIALEKEEQGTMRDTLNKMEKLYVIESSDSWDEVRKVRNDIVHEYKSDFDEIAQNLNELADFTPELLKIVDNVKNYAKKEFDINI